MIFVAATAPPANELSPVKMIALSPDGLIAAGKGHVAPIFARLRVDARRARLDATLEVTP